MNSHGTMKILSVSISYFILPNVACLTVLVYSHKVGRDNNYTLKPIVLEFRLSSFWISYYVYVICEVLLRSVA